MSEEKKKISLWQRLQFKYRISVLNEQTLAEKMHIRLNGIGAIVVVAVLFLLTMGLFSLVILYTPVKNYLPGYSEDIRQNLMKESACLDSIGTSLELQRQYLTVIKQVVAGEVHTDTVQSLDSMQIIMREQLLEAKSEAAAEFVAQYEAKERDNLQLFDIAQTAPVLSYFSPAHGVILQSFSSQNHSYGVAIQTPLNENITAVLRGTVIQVTYVLDNTCTLMLQHESAVSIYAHVAKPLKQVGDIVQAGESIALAGDQPLWFELWQNGQAINPEEVIAF